MIYYGFFGNQRREKTWIDPKDLEFTIFCEAAKPSLYLYVRSYNWDDATMDVNALSCLWQSWCYAGRGVGGWGVLTFKTLILLLTTSQKRRVLLSMSKPELFQPIPNIVIFIIVYQCFN